MPKIIHNIHQRIECEAMALFNEYDFNQVDMKMIAQKCHIAVGTLYNYYPNKKQLFIQVMQKAWLSTSSDLDHIYASHLTPEEKLSQSIQVLYDDIALRKGMGKSIYKILANYEMDEDIMDLFHQIFFKIERLFEPFEKKSFLYPCQSLDIRLAKSLITIIQNTIVSYPSTREDNLHFIQDFFYNSMHVDVTLKKQYLEDHEI
ncbi:MAG: TetR/AcrR family transcriptional regulator [Cellulosilyticaceae bacterium]